MYHFKLKTWDTIVPLASRQATAAYILICQPHKSWPTMVVFSHHFLLWYCPEYLSIYGIKFASNEWHILLVGPEESQLLIHAWFVPELLVVGFVKKHSCFIPTGTSVVWHTRKVVVKLCLAFLRPSQDFLWLDKLSYVCSGWSHVSTLHFFMLGYRALLLGWEARSSTRLEYA